MPPPLVIGHAGGAGEGPENSLAAIHASIAANADAIEIDIQLTADGVPVLMHDLDIARTSTGRGRVDALRLPAIRTARLSNGEPIPTLAEALDLVSGRLTVFCELKVDHQLPSPNLALVRAVGAAVGDAGAGTWAAVHSFDPRIVAAGREQLPHLPAALIAPAPTDEGAFAALLGRALKRGAQAVSVEHQALDPGRVRQAQLRQLTAWAWTADSEADWERLAAAGVDGIITNQPKQLRAWLDAR